MYKTILLPVDLNEQGFSDIAAKHACALAAISGATIHLLNVLPTSNSPLVSAYFPATALAEIRKKSQSALAAFAAQHISADIPTQLHIIEGKPSKEITKAATLYQVDLIIMPSHKHAKLELAVMGSVASRVVTTAAMSVLVVKPE